MVQLVVIQFKLVLQTALVDVCDLSSDKKCISEECRNSENTFSRQREAKH